MGKEMGRGNGEEECSYGGSMREKGRNGERKIMGGRRVSYE